MYEFKDLLMSYAFDPTEKKYPFLNVKKMSSDTETINYETFE